MIHRFAFRDLSLEMSFVLIAMDAMNVVVTVITRGLLEEGKAHWIEGFLLLRVYVILAIGFYHLPG